MNSSLYELEHHLIPESFFGKSCHDFIGAILNEKGNFFVDVLNWLNQDVPNYTCPFSPAQFKVRPFKTATGHEVYPYFYMVQLTMPDPDVSPLCKRVYICHDEMLGNRSYYTVELTTDGNWMLCGWNSRGMHLNYGDCPDDEELEIQQIEDLYINSLPKK